MNTAVAILLFLTCVIYRVHADCYTDDSCTDLETGKTYGPGVKWRPSSNPCYACYCYNLPKLVITCKEAVEAPKITNVRKSSLSSKLIQSKFEEDVPEDIEIELTQEEAESKECDPVRAPTFNYMTWEFEEVKYRSIYYFYNKQQSTCCSRFFSYTNSSPDCEIQKVGQCKSRVVLKSDPTKLCNSPMYMVG